MSHAEGTSDRHHADTAPGDRHTEEGGAAGIRTYLIGFGLAVLLTVVSFLVARTSLVWQPSIPIALFVLAIAQMGVHLVFFLHITTGPDNTNNVLALAFGVLIVFLVIAGSLWIMAHLNANMLPMDQMMRMQRWIWASAANSASRRCWVAVSMKAISPGESGGWPRQGLSDTSASLYETSAGRVGPV